MLFSLPSPSTQRVSVTLCTVFPLFCNIAVFQSIFYLAKVSSSISKTLAVFHQAEHKADYSSPEDHRLNQSVVIPFFLDLNGAGTKNVTLSISGPFDNPVSGLHCEMPNHPLACNKNCHWAAIQRACIKDEMQFQAYHNMFITRYEVLQSM